jgi:peptide-methionine (S)-S-oxide reductase
MKTLVTLETATLAGGCFWCIEAVFEQVEGVKDVVSGYAGGHTDNPTYKTVSSGKTGYAETCQIRFDSTIISYEKILDIFWQAHDPTTFNRQGADVGSQYRSVIFYHTEEQKRIAFQSKDQVAKDFDQPIVTEILPFTKFYPAEDYHQDYFKKNPNAPYCIYVIQPKLDKLKKHGGIFD